MEIWQRFESGTPSPADRIGAMRCCAAAGYRVRAVIMPILPVPQWREAYAGLLRDLLAMVPIERITLGSLCSFPNAIRLMEDKLGRDNEISSQLSNDRQSADGRYRFPTNVRVDCYRCLLEVVRKIRPDLTVSLCLEEQPVFRKLRLEASMGKCNCVL